MARPRQLECKISMWVEPALRERIERGAATEGRTISNYVRMLLVEYYIAEAARNETAALRGPNAAARAA